MLAMPWIAAGLALALVALWLVSSEREREPARASLDVASLLGANSGEGFLRAEAPREFEFPRDHAAHDGFKTEWWYFTGNLAAESGRRFGYQLTFFRSALAAKSPERSSTFAADHVWMAHFALSDIDGKEFTSFERFARESGAIAGANANPVSIWLKDWRCDFGPDGLPIHVAAREGELSIDFSLTSAKPPVLQGDRGLSQKTAGAGNASYYYSLTRLETSGAVGVDGATFEVSGFSWMDREWSSGELGKERIGWDWFALQLDDGSELMWYRLRHADGSLDPFNSGSFVDAQGSSQPLAASDVVLTESATWTSPRSKAVYPARWRLQCPRLNLDLELEPALADQELGGAFRYWEGAVEVRGTRAGRGYVELVGYSTESGEFVRSRDGHLRAANAARR